MGEQTAERQQSGPQDGDVRRGELTSIGEILFERGVGPRRERGPTLSFEEARHVPPLSEEPECARCRDAGFVSVAGSVGSLLRVCPCKLPALEGRLAASGIDGPQSWATWRPTAVMQPAEDAVRALLRGERWCTFLRSSPGSGKTHLAIAAARQHTEEGGHARFCVVPDLIEDLRSCFGTEDFGALQRFLDERIYRAELLVLDDLGAERETPFAREQVFAIVNRFYRDRFSGRKLLVTTNVHEDNDRLIEYRVADRLAAGAVVIHDAPSARARYDR